MRNLIVSIAAILGIAVLMSCGGGGGNSNDPAPVVPSPPRADLLYGYYGMGDGQIAATAAHVNFVHVVDWGNWDFDRQVIIQRQIAQMQEARARGVHWVMLSPGFLMFDSNLKYLGVDAVRAYRAQLDALDLSRSVIAFYPLDEPDMHGVSDAAMAKAYNDLKAAWPGPKVAVIYGDHGTPGISAADWIGHDAYGLGAGALDRLPPIRADQRYIVDPGGADPWRNDPSPFKSFADAHASVAVIMPFLWIDYSGGKGIGDNGMAPAYTAIGAAVKVANPGA